MAVASRFLRRDADLAPAPKAPAKTTTAPAASCGDCGTCQAVEPCANAIDEALKLAANRIASLTALAPKGEPWTGWRPFEIVNRIEEADHQVTFELKPCDGEPIPGYKPGQFLTVGLTINDVQEQRCYSLSDSPQQDVYRITIKRVLARGETAPAGKVSNFIHDQLQVGKKLEVKSPAGEFVLDMAKTTPAVFIAGGVGVTPFLSMLKMVADTGSERQVHLFYAVEQTSELVRAAELRELAARHPNIKVSFVVAKPKDSEQPGVHFHHTGRISMDLLKSQLPKGNYDFFMCGPGPMMAAMTEAFQHAGVSHRNIHTESFGAAPAKPASASPLERALGVNTPAVEVHFVGVNRTVAFSPDKGSLLEQGLADGIELNSMCRSGSCKGCQCSLVSGKVEYPLGDPGVPPGKVLPCVAVPLAGEPVVINETIARS
ncbi:MAG: FAD-binding oxidoreductase [Myxococcota bacterium]